MSGGLALRWMNMTSVWERSCACHCLINSLYYAYKNILFSVRIDSDKENEPNFKRKEINFQNKHLSFSVPWLLRYPYKRSCAISKLSMASV